MRVEFLGPAHMDKIYRAPLAALADEGYDVVRRHGANEEIAQAVAAETDVLVAFGGVAVGRDVLARLPNLRALISPVTGTENFDEPAATGLEIVVANGQIPENYTSMAEAAIMLVLASLYDLQGAETILQEGRPRPDVLKARMLSGKSIGLIGFGQIARAMADRLQAWGCRIVASVRTPRPLPPGVMPSPLTSLLRESDVVVVLASLNAETRGLLGREQLSLMKDEVVFVNVARGGIVDEQALAELALARPQMRIAVDVFERLPLPADHPLRRAPNAILTPHMIGHTRETHDRLPVVLLDSIRRALAGMPPEFVRNPEVLPRWTARWGQPR